MFANDCLCFQALIVEMGLLEDAGARFAEWRSSQAEEQPRAAAGVVRLQPLVLSQAVGGAAPFATAASNSTVLQPGMSLLLPPGVVGALGQFATWYGGEFQRAW